MRSLEVVLRRVAVVAVLVAAFPAAAQSPPRLVTFFFDPTGTCPAGWKEAIMARGRLVMGTTNPARSGRPFGFPFKPADPQPTHVHETRAHVAGVERFQQKLHYEAGPAALLFLPDVLLERQTTSPASFGLPFMQMVVCEYEGSAELLDTLPIDAVAFFDGTACPARPDGFQWIPYSKGDGRFIVPISRGGQHERQVNDPWTDGPHTQHVHNMNEAFTPPQQDIKGDGTWCDILCGATEFAKFPPGVQIKFQTQPNIPEVPVPYVELMVCRKSGNRRKRAPLPPPLFTFFSATGNCPDYYNLPTSAGRFLVGLPENAEPNRVFGRALSDGEDRTHKHTVPVPALPAQVVNVGKFRTIDRGIPEQLPGSMQLPPGSPGIPYVQLSQCWWKCPVCPGANSEQEGKNDGHGSAAEIR
jgi:hypothetical protein